MKKKLYNLDNNRINELKFRNELIFLLYEDLKDTHIKEILIDEIDSLCDFESVFYTIFNYLSEINILNTVSRGSMIFEDNIDFFTDYVLDNEFIPAGFLANSAIEDYCEDNNIDYTLYEDTFDAYASVIDIDSSIRNKKILERFNELLHNEVDNFISSNVNFYTLSSVKLDSFLSEMYLTNKENESYIQFMQTLKNLVISDFPSHLNYSFALEEIIENKDNSYKYCVLLAFIDTDGSIDKKYENLDLKQVLYNLSSIIEPTF